MADEDCNCPEPPPPGAPGWMTTFGDMMSLLLTFFILLVSFSSIQEVEFQKAMGSLKGALGVLASNRSTINLYSVPNTNVELHKLAIIRPELEKFAQLLKELKLADGVIVEPEAEAVRFTLKDDVLFNLGEARLKPAVFPVLREIARIAREQQGILRIEGHTDDLPIKTLEFPSNWELSSARAINVLHFFENMKIPRGRLACAGYADTQPIAPNTNPANRNRNRRVEIFLEFGDKTNLEAIDAFQKMEKKLMMPKDVSK